MADKKEKENQVNCCQDSSLTSAKEELAKATTSCCSTKKEIPSGLLYGYNPWVTYFAFGFNSNPYILVRPFPLLNNDLQ